MGRHFRTGKLGDPKSAPGYAPCPSVSICGYTASLALKATQTQTNGMVAVKKQPMIKSGWLRGTALGVALLLVAGVDIMWQRLDARATRQSDWVDHTHQVIAKTEEILARSGDMSTGHRGFALTREAEFLQAYRTATNRMPYLIEELSTLTADNPGQAARTERLARLLAKHEQINRDHITKLLQMNPTYYDSEFPRILLASSDALRSVTREMVNEENARLAQRRDELDEDTRRVTIANITSGLLSIGLLLGVFRALWRENDRRREAEDRLRELVEQRTASLNLSRERLRLAQQAARIGAFEWNLQTGENVWSPELEAMYGLAPGHFPTTQAAWEKLIYPDDRAEAAARIRQTIETGNPTEGEWRVLWPDGSLHWLFGRFQAFKDATGRAVTVTGVNIDITERKRLERETIEASDREMRRIGHDLHDSVGQQLTALSLLVYGEQKLLQTRAPDRAESFQHIAAGLREVVRQLRVLSHGLSPVSLEENGLPEALRKLAADTRRAAGVECDFTVNGTQNDLDPEVAAQLYRIGQEAVNNALKHGAALTIRIELAATPAGLELAVSDNGRGFAPAAPPSDGLGLRTMKYRAGLIGAALQIDSTPGLGTRVICTLAQANQTN